MQTGDNRSTVISLEADPSFAQLARTGALVATSAAPHTVLDGMFLVSGEIPRRTAYENGLRKGLRFIEGLQGWVSDEIIRDERFLMCNLKGSTEQTPG